MSSGLPPPGQRSAALPLSVAGCGVLLAILAWTTRDVPFLLDDLTAIDLLWQDGQFEPARFCDLVWPIDVRYSYNEHFRPVGWTSLFLDLALFGPRPDFLRAVAWLLHTLCALLTATAAWRMTRGGGHAGAVLAGSIFLLHPVCAEPVVWVAHRFTLLATLFFLVALHAVLTHAREGRGLWLVMLASLLALGSKDSQLSAIWTLAVLAPLLAPAGERVKRGLVTTAGIGACFAIVMGLRRLATGSWLPSLSGAGDVVADFSPLERLQEGPGVLAALFAPDAGAGTLSASLGGACLVCCLAAVVGLVRRRPPGAGPACVLLVLLLGAGVPAWGIGEHLAGSRQLYLPLAAAALVLAAGLSRWWPLALVLPALLACSLLLRCGDFRAAGEQVDRVTHAIAERGAPGSRLLVGGLPATWRGAPLFGERSEHLPIRFRPPLSDFVLPVEGVSEQDWPRCLEGRERPLRMLAFESDDSSGSRQLSVRFAAEIPEATAASNPLLSLITPGPGEPWDGDRVEIQVTMPAPVEPVPFLLEVQAGDDAAAMIAVVRGVPVPGVRRTRFEIVTVRDSVWMSAGVSRLLSRATGARLPATLTVSAAALDGHAGHGAGSVRGALILVREP